METATTQQAPTAAPTPATEPVEPRAERLRRHSRRTRLYTWAFGTVALLVVLIALVLANTGNVRVSWVVGSGRASLVWMMLSSAVLFWLLGIVTSVSVYRRTRRRHAPRVPAAAAPEA
jgi:uncharacterized integral membrane protein